MRVQAPTTTGETTTGETTTGETTTGETMTCETAVELLPWLLNGSLEATESAALSRHLAACASCRRELEETAEVSRMLTWHVPSHALAEYAEGVGSSGLDDELIERHLALCPSCREEIAWAKAGDVVDFAAARRQRNARLGRRAGAGRRLAMAAAVGATVIAGGLLWRAGNHETDLAPSVVVAQASEDSDETRRAPNKSGQFIDGFESGDTNFWSSTAP